MKLTIETTNTVTRIADRMFRIWRGVTDQHAVPVFVLIRDDLVIPEIPSRDLKGLEKEAIATNPKGRPRVNEAWLMEHCPWVLPGATSPAPPQFTQEYELDLKPKSEPAPEMRPQHVSAGPAPIHIPVVEEPEEPEEPEGEPRPIPEG